MGSGTNIDVGISHAHTHTYRVGYSMALRTCTVCAIPSETARCPAHAYWRTQDMGRGTSTQRGYDSAWRRLVSHVVLPRDGYRCQIAMPGVCAGRANTGDHIVPLSQGGERLDPDNVQAACSPCNSSKRERIA